MLKCNYSDLERAIGYSFKDRTLLRQAFTHSSYVNEQHCDYIKDYEVLEFEGDAVIELVTRVYLNQQYPEMNEGQLTQFKISLVCEKALSRKARELQLSEYIKVGKGEEKTGGRYRDSILCDVIESLTGAIYKDSDYQTAEQFVLNYILNDVEHNRVIDYKSRLQKVTQELKADLRYRVNRTDGTENNLSYYVDCYIKNKIISSGIGNTKKSAEQQAASKALTILNNMY